MSSIQHNDRIRMFYEHLITNHKKPKVALIACMRKILLIAHQIYANKSGYKPLRIDNKIYVLPLDMNHNISNICNSYKILDKNKIIFKKNMRNVLEIYKGGSLNTGGLMWDLMK